MDCPYCGREAAWVENKEIYGRNYGDSHMCYLCKECDAYVGCHDNTKKPLGTMADKELREWRVKAHAALDPLWKSGKMTRREAYKMLDAVFGQETHIASSGIEDCKRIIREVSKLKAKTQEG